MTKPREYIFKSASHKHSIIQYGDKYSVNYQIEEPVRINGGTYKNLMDAYKELKLFSRKPELIRIDEWWIKPYLLGEPLQARHLSR